MSGKFDNYYLGLDVGTNSVGWAVTDAQYNVLKSSGKFMWGIHLFDSGETAKDRRTKRCARRRRDRAVQRIALLQELFGDEIRRVDPGFFDRLKESALWTDDRTVQQKNSLFNDEAFHDSDYHRTYKTAYHLRKALMENVDQKFDIRLVYLAVAHILKSRGHFLFQGQKFELNGAFHELYASFISAMQEYMGMELNGNAEVFAEALRTKGMKRTSEAIMQLWGSAECKKDKRLTEFAKLLAGQKVKTRILIENKDGDESEDFYQAIEESEAKEFQFSKADYEETKLPLLEMMLGDQIEVLYAAKALYDWSVLSNILGDATTLSDAMIQRYEAHVKQLGEVKALIRKYDRKKYIALFKNEKESTGYIAWIGKGKFKENASRCQEEDFYKNIKSVLEACSKKADPSEAAMIQTWLKAIEEKTFLQRQRVSTNGVIPYQLHLAELERILANAEKHYPFLACKDDSGWTISEKILSLHKFRIPYYVGPLSDKHKADENTGHAWIVRNPGYEYTPIRPWNFEQVVNLDACAEAFIRRMTNKCTYLCDCDVLPKDSLLYSEFMVLNEINNIQVNHEYLDVATKQKLFHEIYHDVNIPKVKLKHIIDALNHWNASLKCTKEHIQGIDIDLKADLKSYKDFARILGGTIKFDSDKEMVEDCILAIVLFGDEKEMLKRRIRRKYGADSEHPRLTEDQIEQISKLKYRDWGRLSREFLTLESHDKTYGECRSIRQALYETQDNLMQLLSKSSYAYTDWIVDYNREHAKNDGSFTYDNLVRHLYCSPAVKRSIWRALSIVKDILRVTKKAPARIFVEMAREEQKEKKRTVSRKDKLLEQYKKLTGAFDKAELDTLKQHLNAQTEDDLKRYKDKLYLYYTQLGRCMYSGEKIRLDDLMNTNVYDIDHIYPQSLTMDNSLDNRVLVKKTLNEEKSDTYPIPEVCKTANAMAHWKVLKDKGLISEEKYSRLIRTIELSDEELAGFISRQLVETRQSSKAIIEALKSVFKDEKTELVYARAGHVSEFRKAYEITKCRDLNDFHHAYDAYLNIVVGNVYHTRFTSSPMNFIKDAPKRSYNLVIKKLLAKNIERAGVRAWTADKDASLINVKKWLSNTRILFTRYAFEATGEFYDQMPLKKGHGQIPLKSSNPKFHHIERYGGYNKDGGAYFVLVEHKEKKKKYALLSMYQFDWQRRLKNIPSVWSSIVKTKRHLVWDW